MMESSDQATAVFPPLEHQNYDLDITIRIEKATDREYRIETWIDRKWRRFFTRLTSSDLVEINTKLQKALESMTRQLSKGEVTAEQQKSQLNNLAEVGCWAFKRIFGRSEAGAALICALDQNPHRTIQIASEDFFLPWEALYPVSEEDPKPSWERFWGMRCMTNRLISPQEGDISPTILVKDKPLIGLLTDLKLNSVREKEIPFFETQEKNGRISLTRVPRLDATSDDRKAEFKKFQELWIKDTLNLAHFACHAYYNDTTPSDSYFELSDDFQITLEDLIVKDFEIVGHPLVMMNACETGVINPLYTSQFAAAFIHYGALGVVATECQIPDTFAADFAAHLYTLFLSGLPLGDSLMQTRRHFLEAGNPSGLVYAMYAPPSTQLRSSPKRAESIDVDEIPITPELDSPQHKQRHRKTFERLRTIFRRKHH